MLIIIKNVILWIGWPFLVGGTIYILLRGKAVLKLVRGSLVGKLSEGLMLGLFI